MRIPDRLRRRLVVWATRYTARRRPDVVIGGDYLFRWWVFRSRWFRVYLHVVQRSDDNRALHDHPWVNASVILRGSYLEVMERKNRYLVPGRIVFRRATFRHRLVVVRGPVISLFFTGPKIRELGFWPYDFTAKKRRWVHWKDFVESPESNAARKAAE